MLTVAEMHQRRCAADIVLFILVVIRTVKVEIRCFYTGCAGICIFIIIISNKESEVTGGQRCAILQLCLRAVIVDQLNGVHHGSCYILIISAINDAYIVNQYISL